MKSKAEHLYTAINQQRQQQQQRGEKEEESLGETSTAATAEVDGEGEHSGEIKDVDEDEVEVVEEIVEMSDEEARVLMSDIRKKLFHLKKSICEAVEVWNSKYELGHYYQ